MPEVDAILDGMRLLRVLLVMTMWRIVEHDRLCATGAPMNRRRRVLLLLLMLLLMLLHVLRLMRLD